MNPDVGLTACRLLVRAEHGEIERHLVRLDRPLFRVLHPAIHLDHGVNDREDAGQSPQVPQPLR